MKNWKRNVAIIVSAVLLICTFAVPAVAQEGAAPVRVGELVLDAGR